MNGRKLNKVCQGQIWQAFSNKDRKGFNHDRKDLIETRSSLRKKFKNAVKELMEE